MTDRLTELARMIAEIMPAVALRLLEEAARREAEAKPGPRETLAQAYDEALAPTPPPPNWQPDRTPQPLWNNATAPAVEGLVAHAEVTADGELRLMTEEPTYEPPAFALRETWEIIALAMNQTSDLLLNQNDPRYALLHEFANKLGERSEELKEYAKTLPFQSERIEDKPAPADDDFAHSLRSVVTVDHAWPPMALSIIRRYEADRHNAADKIDEQVRHVAHWRGSFINEQKANDTLKARVAELEARAKNAEGQVSAIAKALAWEVPYQADLVTRLDGIKSERDSYKSEREQAEAKAARLVDALEYIAHHVDGTTRESIRQTAFNALAALLKENKDAP